MKKNLLAMALGLTMILPASAQSWNKWDTRSTIDGVLLALQMQPFSQQSAKRRWKSKHARRLSLNRVSRTL